MKGKNAKGNQSRRKKGVQHVTATTGGKAKKREMAPAERAEEGEPSRGKKSRKRPESGREKEEREENRGGIQPEGEERREKRK